MKKIIFWLFIIFFAFLPQAEAKYVTLVGYLNLSGNVYVPSQNSYASGYVSGWVSLKDSFI